MVGCQSLAHRYREVAIKTASPLQIIVMLYDAAICSIQEARDQIGRRDIAGRSRAVNKAIAIVSALQSCLNLKGGGEIAASLDRLYDYMKRQIFRANVEQSSQTLAEIAALLENLRSAWVELVSQTQSAEMPSSGKQMPDGNPSEAVTTPATQPNSLNISI